MSSHGEGGASLPHSHSSPSGMYPTPSSPESRSLGKRLPVQVHFLDDSVASFNIQFKALGKVLFDQVCKLLNLLETDYFGLEYIDCAGTKFWLDYEKPMCRQMGLSMINPIMSFCVKFYTPDPAQLEEEYTRYLFSLQIKRDLAQGILLCNDNTAALMASYIVQAECGDFVSEDYPDHTYVSSFKFVPHQDAEFEHKIMENHKKHIGQSPAEADLNLLETARRCELYGIKMTPAKDSEGVPLNLAAAHMGVLVFQNYTKINTFSWAKIRKISFKRRKFLIKLHPEGYGYYKDTVEFVFESRNECKNFWKKCIENHAFFRCSEVKRLPRQKTRIFSRGSSFRYSGRTQKQMVEYVRENYVKRQPFQRSTSLRVSSTNRRGLGMVGASLSAQPLLPVSSSQSCGSVILSHDVETPSAYVSRPTSASQPSSPRVNKESSRVIANRSICIDSRSSYLERRDLPPGLLCSKLNKDVMEGDLHSPDILSNYSEENYSDNFSDHYLSDNTSHNSYSLDHKHSLSDSVVYQNCRDTLTLSDNKSDHICNISSDSKAPFDTKQTSLGSEGEVAKGELLSNLIKDLSEICHQNSVEVEGGDEEITTTTNGDITYILHKLDKSQKSLSPLLKPSPKPVLRVEVEHALKTHGSPTLYARAGCFSTSKKNKFNHNVKNLMRSKTVDFVSVSQLPAADSFSSQDDSLEDSVGKVLKECKRKCNSEPISGRGMLKHSFSKHSSTDSQDMDYVISNKDGSYYRFATDDLTDSIEMIISKKQGKKKLSKFKHSATNVSFEASDTLDSKIPLEYPDSSGFMLSSGSNDAIPQSEAINYIEDQTENEKPMLKEHWLNHCPEEYLGDSSSSSEILYSGNSTSSLDDMLQLSDLRLYDTHLSSSEEDPTVADDDEFDQSHILDYQEENLGKQVLYEDGVPQKTMNESDCETCDENSLNEVADVLEDITEHTETFSDGETAQIIDDNLSCGSTRSIESIPSTPSKTSSCIKEEIASPVTSQNPVLQPPGTLPSSFKKVD
ncbi:FERM, ARHGEF and pleckstrin domain-containing protein 1 [Nephila pilipes]|uniref:Moesin/ezrin/radixin homolog 1 n=1 Tax=Nephila pilipes TaxID=299642 RepID=A0A8X6P5U5_NEPPI|nr:FERM, ARHGEF and pleckstrin domain-containing protein 1 [Nephila pilipes]